MLPASVPVESNASRSQGEPILACSALRKIYRMGEVDVRALDGVDFSLHKGEFLVLLGPSGSGKSTLLNILGGLDVATSGRVFFGREELTDASEDVLTRYRRKNVGFVFQFYNLIPSLTARENVALVTDIADDSRLVQEEQFGPIVPILKFSDIEDALRRANDTRYGLSGSIWTKDLERGAELAARLEVGTAWVNQHRTTSAVVPFGGAKESGLGRQYSALGLKSYMEPEVVSVAKR